MMGLRRFDETLMLMSTSLHLIKRKIPVFDLMGRGIENFIMVKSWKIGIVNIFSSKQTLEEKGLHIMGSFERDFFCLELV